MYYSVFEEYFQEPFLGGIFSMTKSQMRDLNVPWHFALYSTTFVVSFDRSALTTTYLVQISGNREIQYQNCLHVSIDNTNLTSRFRFTCTYTI